ncbi:MAG TPA: helix-turn-helix domain-containing protein [Nocardioidaceae bacterium]|jgi:AcrR family transcriptional regulator
MVRRADQMDATRERIIEATVHLHGTVGPAHTTVAGIAERAGVTRLTVYRHFPDEDTLFEACTSHWRAQQRMPDVDAWMQIPGPVERVAAALEDVYRFFSEAETMLTLTARDREALPSFVHERNRQVLNAQTAAVLDAWPQRQRTKLRRRLIGHALTFSTWRSLSREQGLTRRDAVAAMTRLVVEC